MNFIKYIKKKITTMILRAERKLPIQNKIVLECESDMEDNPMAFFEYLLSVGWNEKNKIIWIVKDIDYCSSHYREKNVEFLRRENHKNWIEFIIFNYHIATAKWFIISHPWWIQGWRNGQYVVNTTHSVAQLKQAGNLAEKKICDYVLACSDYCVEIKKKTFGNHPNYLCLGIPRLDWMLNHCDCKKILLKERSDKNLILSMETFKQSKNWSDSKSATGYAINVIHNEKDILELDEFLESINSVMIVKIHHLQDLQFLNKITLKNVMYLQDCDLLKMGLKTNRLLENADVLLTDYSSVFYDYLLVDRPIGFLLADMELYSRGFIMENPLDEMPGEKIRTLSELKGFLTKTVAGEDSLKNERVKIREKVFQYIDDKNCERLYNWMLSK